jgi:murein tripeptide amidase MpaA
MRYDDYSVVRFYGLNTTDVMELDENYDVWTKNRIGGWVDVMLHQNQLDQVLQKHTNYEIRIPNVQTQIDEAEAAPSKSNPNIDPIFEKFPTTAEVNAFLDEQIKAHPLVTRSIVIGQTYEGRPIRGILIGSNPDSPIFYFQCTIHAREWITTTTCCWMIDQLLNEDPEREWLLEHANWMIVPILNVDGYEFTREQRMWRKSRQPAPGSTCLGIDLNRNYDAHWGGPGASPNPCSDTYYGTAPASSPEISAEQKFLADLGQNLVSFVDIHTTGAMFMSPFGWTTDYPPATDYTVMDYYMKIAVEGIKSVNDISYDYGSVANVIYTVSGGSNDWAYGDLGIISSYAIEIFGSGFSVPVENIEPRAKEIWAGLRAMVKAMVT